MSNEWEPLIISAKLTPDPATVGTAVLLQVSAIDVHTVEQQVELRQAGEFQAGVV